jgi:chaperonin cofactor prefoldin
LGSVRGESESIGDAFGDATSQGNSMRLYRNKKSSVYSGQRSFGKILSQLKELQPSHLADLESHEEILKVRLQVAQEHHNQVLEQMKLLEQEIIFLMKEEY